MRANSRTEYLAAIRDLADLVEEAGELIDDTEAEFDALFELFQDIHQTADRALHSVVMNAAQAGTLPPMPR
jgi:hypothetical protein